jgi:uncharacterized protein
MFLTAHRVSVQIAPSPSVSRPTLCLMVLMTAICSWGTGCASHSEHTRGMRLALNAGDARGAIQALNKEMAVEHDKDQPAKLDGSNALFVLDRATIQLALGQHKLSQHDFEAADKALDLLDLSRNGLDSLGEYLFSDSAGKYAAPPHEKLLLNSFNMLNYLETFDLNGARVEARRLSVMNKYYREKLEQPDNSLLTLGGYLAGFTFEKSGMVDEALRYYDEAIAIGPYESLADPLHRLLPQSRYRTPNLEKNAKLSTIQTQSNAEEGELLLIVGYGRVPHKIAERIPIGLALTYASGFMSPASRATANRLALQGLVTWINFPTLSRARGEYALPTASVDNHEVPLELAVDIASQVRADWEEQKGKVMASAITRMITRIVAGEGVRQGTKAVTGNGVIGLLASLGTQATLTATDVPDTRSWETLPARVAVARIRLPVGKHVIRLATRGYTRQAKVNITKGGWAVFSLMALR